jgi:hypothetical protein
MQPECEMSILLKAALAVLVELCSCLDKAVSMCSAFIRVSPFGSFVS